MQGTDKLTSSEGTDNLTRRLGLALPSSTYVARYVADSAHSNTGLSLSVAPNTHFPVRKKLTCQYAGDGLTIGPRIHISHFGDENGRWRNFEVQPHCRNLLRSTLQSTITSIRNAISTTARISSSAARSHWTNGGNSPLEAKLHGDPPVPDHFPLTVPCD